MTAFNRRLKKDQRGVTYVETLVYVVVASITMFTLAYFILGVLFDRTRAAAALETQENARYAIGRIVREIRFADSIQSSSTFDSNLALPANGGNILGLKMASSTVDPTEFSVQNYRLILKQGSATGTPITSSDVRVTDFILRNFSVGKARHVGVLFTVEYLNPTGGLPFSASTTLRAGATLRNR